MRAVCATSTGCPEKFWASSRFRYCVEGVPLGVSVLGAGAGAGSCCNPHCVKCALYSSSLIILWQRRHSRVFISVRTFLFRNCRPILVHPRNCWSFPYLRVGFQAISPCSRSGMEVTFVGCLWPLSYLVDTGTSHALNAFQVCNLTS